MVTNNDIIDARKSSNYVIKDSDGPAACLEKEGLFDMTLKAIKLNEKASEAGNRTVSATFMVNDDDFEGAKGATIYHSFPVTGEVASGPNKGQQNVRVLIDMCNSAGRADLAEQIIGKEFAATPLLASLLGDGQSTHVYARLVQQEDDRSGKMKSQPLFYLARGKAKYDEAKASGGANFRSRPRNARKAVGAGAPTSTGTSGVSSAAVKDAMDAEV